LVLLDFRIVKEVGNKMREGEGKEERKKEKR